MRTRRTRVAAIAAALVCVCAVASYATGSSAPTRAQADTEAAQLLKRPAQSRPLVKVVTPAAPFVRLDPRRDYTVRIQPGAVFTKSVTIVGGRTVVVEPGELRYARPTGAPLDWRVRGLYLKGQTRMAWVSGLTIRGPLNEGINLDQRMPKAVVVLRDITVDPVHGTASGHHADLLQTWAGPAKLLVDGFTGTSDYQGFFLTPNQQFRTGPKPSYFWLRGVDLDLRLGYYALWVDQQQRFPVYVRNTTVARNPTRMARDRWLWPKPSTGDRTWANVVGR